MRNPYSQTQAFGLAGEAAYQELYARLARWTGEAEHLYRTSQTAEGEAKLNRCIELLGYMDRGIDLAHSRDIAVTILSLHRFAIRTLVTAKSERDPLELAGLVKVFIALGEIFAAIQLSQAAAAAV